MEPRELVLDHENGGLQLGYPDGSQHGIGTDQRHDLVLAENHAVELHWGWMGETPHKFLLCKIPSCLLDLEAFSSNHSGCKLV